MSRCCRLRRHVRGTGCRLEVRRGASCSSARHRVHAQAATLAFARAGR